jgi:hypothetical protein
MLTTQSPDQNEPTIDPSNADIYQLKLNVKGSRLPGVAYMPPNPNATVLMIREDRDDDRTAIENELISSLLKAQMGVILVRLLNEQERVHSAHLRRDVPKQADRLASLVDLFQETLPTKGAPLGLFGAGTAGAVALAVGPLRRNEVKTTVVLNVKPRCECFAGEPDLPPTLFVIDSREEEEVRSTVHALDLLEASEKSLEVVGRSETSIEESEPSKEVATLAASWFLDHLTLL